MSIFSWQSITVFAHFMSCMLGRSLLSYHRYPACDTERQAVQQHGYSIHAPCVQGQEGPKATVSPVLGPPCLTGRPGCALPGSHTHCSQGITLPLAGFRSSGEKRPLLFRGPQSGAGTGYCGGGCASGGGGGDGRPGVITGRSSG